MKLQNPPLLQKGQSEKEERVRNAPALAHLILSAARLAEVAHWRQFGIHGRVIEPSLVEVLDRLRCVLFASEFHVHIADHVLAKIVAHVHLLYLAVLVLQLAEDLLEEIVEV